MTVAAPAKLDAVTASQARAVANAIEKVPGFFSEAVLGRTLWSKQKQLAQAVKKHRRVLCASGHGVGKTATLATIICEWMTQRPQARVICMASTWHQVQHTLWGEVKNLHARARYPLGGKMMETKWTIDLDGALATCLSVDDPTALQGVHGPAVLIVVDEAEGLSQNMWNAIESLMSSEGSRLVACFNPVTPAGYLFDAARRPEEWHYITISCLDHPNVIEGRNVIPGAVTREWVDEMREKHGEDSAFWASRVLGRFPAAGSNTLVSLADIAASAKWETGIREHRRMGLDVARFGGDANCLTILDETRTVIASESWRGEDLMATTGRAIAAMKTYAIDPRNVCVDVCGVGGGVVDRMREQGYRVQAVDFGAGPVGDWAGLLGKESSYPNRRSELHAVARQLFRAKQISVPEKFREIAADLGSILFSYDSKGRFVVESKDKIRERTGRSPDHSDSLLIALASTGRPKVDIQ